MYCIICMKIAEQSTQYSCTNGTQIYLGMLKCYMKIKILRIQWPVSYIHHIVLALGFNKWYGCPELCPVSGRVYAGSLLCSPLSSCVADPTMTDSGSR